MPPDPRCLARRANLHSGSEKQPLTQLSGLSLNKGRPHRLLDIKRKDGYKAKQWWVLLMTVWTSVTGSTTSQTCLDQQGAMKRGMIWFQLAEHTRWE